MKWQGLPGTLLGGASPEAQQPVYKGRYKGRQRLGSHPRAQALSYGWAGPLRAPPPGLCGCTARTSGSEGKAQGQQSCPVRSHLGSARKGLLLKTDF